MKTNFTPNRLLPIASPPHGLGNKHLAFCGHTIRRNARIFALSFKPVVCSLLFMVCCFLGQQAKGQTTQICFSDELRVISAAIDPELVAVAAMRDQLLRDAIEESKQRGGGSANRNYGENTPYIIPVTVHFIDPSGTNPPGTNLPVTQGHINQVNNALEALNREFHNNNPQGPAVSTNITFCIARDGSNNPRVTRHSSPLSNLNANDQNDVADLRAIGILPVEKFLNIWVVNSISATVNGSTAQVGGIAIPPSWLNAPNQDGIIITNQYFGDAQLSCVNCPTPALDPTTRGRVLTHEAGHYLNLYHTFEGECTALGDEVADTPPTRQPGTSGCPNSTTCQPRACCVDGQGNPIQAQIQNFMDYSPEACINTFTFDQRERMLASIHLQRSELVSPQNLQAANVGCGPGNTIAVIQIASTQACTGTAINFSASDIAIPGATYSWSFGDGLTASGVSPLPQHTYTTAGTFHPSLTVTLQSGASYSTSVTIYVSACNPIVGDKANWYFGNKAAISFTTGTAVAIPGNVTNTFEGTISISNSNGDLLFYGGKPLTGATDMDMVLHTNTHQPLSPTLFAGESSTQQGLVVPEPGTSNQYYIFQTPARETFGSFFDGGGFRYSKISIIGGTPTITTANAIITEPLAPLASFSPSGAIQINEKLTAVQHCNGTDYWIIVRRYSEFLNNQTHQPAFFIYLLTSTGVTYHAVHELNPLYTDEGVLHANRGYIKFSNDGTVLASCEERHVVLLNFDRATGTFTNTNARIIPIPSAPFNQGIAYGVAFSPSDKVLYLSGKYGLFQYDLQAANPASTMNKLQGSTIIPIHSNSPGWRALQLGPDGKIYCGLEERTSLGCINFPDVLNTAAQPNACGFNPEGVSLLVPGNNTIRRVRSGLPNFIDARPAGEVPLAFSYTQTNCTTVNFTATPCQATYSWNFGDGNVGTGRLTEHIYASAGTYTVTLTGVGATTTDTSQIITISQPSSAISGPACIGETTPLFSYSVDGGPVNGVTYSWTAVGGSVVNIGANAQVAWGNTSPRSITLTATSLITGCTSNTTLTITEGAVISGVAQNDCSVLCQGEIALSVTGGAAPFTYSWSNSATTQNISNLCADTYTVTVTESNGCQQTSTFQINSLCGVNLAVVNGLDCDIPSITATPIGGAPPFTYQWTSNNGTQIGNMLSGIPTGTYTVTVTDNNTNTVTASANVVSDYFLINPVISTNEVWDQSNTPAFIRILGTLTIEDGATLWIDDASPFRAVEFVPDNLVIENTVYQASRILVKPGGFLHAVAQDFRGCDGQIWDGIEVWGDPADIQHESVQGKVKVADCIVRDAIIGIRAERRRYGTEQFPQHHNYTGGIVEAISTHFINNDKGIMLRDYPLTMSTVNIPHSASRILENRFSFSPTSPFAAASADMEFVRLENILGVRLIDNVFESSDAFAEHERGTGIYSLNAGYFVTRAPSWNTYVWQKFQDLTRGIDAANANPLAAIQVRGYTFDNVQEGIYIQGGSFDLIEDNTFNVPSYTSSSDPSFGIFMAGAHDFQIKDNTLSMASNGNTYGIVVHNSQGGLGGPEVFNNTLTGGDVQLQVQEQNNTLQIKCNIFNQPVLHGLTVVNNPNPPSTPWPVSTLATQGTGCINHYTPAGNEWRHQGACPTGSDRDIWVDNGVGFMYYAHEKRDDSPDEETQPHCRNFATVDVCYSVDKVTIDPNKSCGPNSLRLSPPPPTTPLTDYEAEIYAAISDLTDAIALLWDDYQNNQDPEMLSQILYREQEQQRLKTELLRQYLYLGEHQKLRDALQADSLIEARMLLAGIYFQYHELQEVRQQMLAIADLDPTGAFYQTQEFIGWLEILVDLSQNGTPISQADQQQIYLLLALIETGFNKAQVVLEPITGRNREEIYPLYSEIARTVAYAPVAKPMPRSKPRAKAVKETAKVFAYPNPTPGNYTVDFLLPEGSVDAVLSIYNVQGIQVGQHRLSGTSGSIALNSTGLPAGLYLLKVSAGGNASVSHKLIVE